MPVRSDSVISIPVNGHNWYVWNEFRAREWVWRKNRSTREWCWEGWSWAEWERTAWEGSCWATHLNLPLWNVPLSSLKPSVKAHHTNTSFLHTSHHSCLADCEDLLPFTEGGPVVWHTDAKNVMVAGNQWGPGTLRANVLENGRQWLWRKEGQS